MVDSLDKLPYLCLKEVFERLDYKSILNCRLVCKLFMYFSDEAEISELIVADEIERSREFWYHTGGQIDCSTAISVNLFVASLTSSPYKLHESVKRLHWEIKQSLEFVLVLLDQMQNLEQLHLLISLSGRVPENLPVISLSKLRILHFSSSGAYAVNRSILVAPSLTHLKTSSPDGLAFIKIDDPTTVKHLEVYKYSAAVDSFENVEHLKLNHLLLHNSHAFNKEILTVLKKLKVLNVNFKRPGELIYSLAREDLAYIQGQMLELGRTVAINVNGVPFVEDVFRTGAEGLIGSMESAYQMDTALIAQLKNYDRLAADLSFVTEIDFNDLMWLMPPPLPDDFFKKFCNIRVVKTAREVDKAEEFIRFLGNLNYLEELNLNCSCLSQFSLDRLPSVCNQIVRFEFWDFKRIPIRFDFVLKFPLLAGFTTNKKFSIYWVAKALKSLPNSKMFHFKSRNSEINVKILPNAYRFECKFRFHGEGDRVRSFTKDQTGLNEMIAFSKETGESSKINQFKSF